MERYRKSSRANATSTQRAAHRSHRCHCHWKPGSHPTAGRPQIASYCQHGNHFKTTHTNTLTIHILKTECFLMRGYRGCSLLSGKPGRGEHGRRAWEGRNSKDTASITVFSTTSSTEETKKTRICTVPIMCRAPNDGFELSVGAQPMPPNPVPPHGRCLLPGCTEGLYRLYRPWGESQEARSPSVAVQRVCTGLGGGPGRPTSAVWASCAGRPSP